VGYIGHRPALPIVVEGLKRLEYRGYDSAGVATIRDGHLLVRKAAGRVSVMESAVAALDAEDLSGTTAIAHTRWATHGAPTDANAHPHCDASGRIAVIHNGIIENCHALRRYLESQSVEFVSETDTEVLAQLIGRFYEGDLEQAVRQALHEADGTYGIAVMCADEPDVLVAARKGSPLIIGVGQGEYLVASDAAAVIEHTTQVIYLSDGEMARITRQGFRTTTLDAVPVAKETSDIEWSLERIELEGYEHFMLKEIFEQPQAVEDCLRGRIDPKQGDVYLGGLQDCARELIRAKRLILTACGTAWHAGLIGEDLFEDLARIPTETEYASEFRYRNPIINGGTVVIAISQSGETADTLAALREAKERGALCLGVVNVVGSTIARDTDAGVYLHVGPEIGVASTKAFVGQLTVLALMATYMGRRRHLSQAATAEFLENLAGIPRQITGLLEQADQAKAIAEAYVRPRPSPRPTCSATTGSTWVGDTTTRPPWKGP
jgi:glucosamine--fructose-6-phosphate aminotransferase (isomerizing)